MILHYAWLCTVAGGVNLFSIGSELRGLETIRGPGWTKAGTVDGSGYAIWDYPFVAGLRALADDVRSIFDGQGLTKNLSALENLVAYSADWSSWMGWQHPGENGQWPHLDQLWAHSNIDYVAFDDYLPLTDWTTGGGGVDATGTGLRPRRPAPGRRSPATMSGLGLDGVPSIYDTRYLKKGIEGGQYFDWFYNDSDNLGRGFDPNGSGLIVSLPEGDRLAQARNPYFHEQQFLANKQLRWWWNNPHHAVYDTGSGWTPQGPQTEWQANSKSILLLEYGFSAIDKATNQPNVFFDPKSSESLTPFWSIWDPAPGLTTLPRRDDTLQALALEAIYEYWNVDGNNATVGGVVMIQFAFSCVWNWDARPFPTFPAQSQNWGDAGKLERRRLVERSEAGAPAGRADAAAGAWRPSRLSRRSLRADGRCNVKPKFSTMLAGHVSGRRDARAALCQPLSRRRTDLRGSALGRAPSRVADDRGLFRADERAGRTRSGLRRPAFRPSRGQAIGTGDGATTTFPLVASIGGYVEPVHGDIGRLGDLSRRRGAATGWTVRAVMRRRSCLRPRQAPA